MRFKQQLKIIVSKTIKVIGYKNSKIFLTFSRNILSVFFAKKIKIEPTISEKDFEIFIKLANSECEKTIIRFEHLTGGGSSFAFFDFVEKNKAKNLILKVQNINKNEYLLSAFYKDLESVFLIKKLSNLTKLLLSVKINNIIINQLQNFYEIKTVLNAIIQIKTLTNAKLEMNIRDFYHVCASTQLLNDESKFCYAEKDITKCEKCNMNKYNSVSTKNNIHKNIEIWRKMWGDFFIITDTINVFSKFTKRTFFKIFSDYINEDKIEIKKIPINYLREAKVDNNNIKKINIGILGIISHHKGLNILQEIDKILIKKNIKHVNLYIFGYIANNYTYIKNLVEKGEYKRNELPDLIEKNKIDIVFVPSICGETYSRTVQEAILMNIPVAVFNIGAPPERVASYKKGLVINEINAELAINEILKFVKEQR